MEDRPFQLEARRQLNTLLNNSRHPVYLAPCGTGKTYTAAALIADRLTLNRRVYVLVPQVEIFDEWMKVLSEHGLNPGYINDEGIRGRDRGVYVCMTLSLINLLPHIPESLYPDEIITDECVTGDTIVETEIGSIRIDEWTKHNPKYILSYDGTKGSFNRVLRFIPRGRREIIEITTESGRQLRCTPDHLVYGESGWITADTLRPGNQIFVNADAGKQLVEIKKATLRPGYPGTGSIKRSPIGNGKSNIKNLSTGPHCVNADAEERLIRDAEAVSECLKNGKRQAGITDISTDMINTKKTGMQRSPLLNSGNLLAHCSGTQVSHLLQNEALHHGLHGLTDCPKENGQSTKQEIFPRLESNYRLSKTQDMARRPWLVDPEAYPYCLKSIPCLLGMVKRELQKAHYLNLPQKVLPGGFATTDRVRETSCISICRDMGSMRTALLKIFFKIDTDRALSARTKGKTCILSRLVHALRVVFLKRSKTLSPNAWHTKYERISGIRKLGESKVYDLEVEKNHCYFTNGILSHNCQHALAASWEMVYRHFDKALRLGLTATLYHGSLRSFEHLYTDVVQTINKSGAIEQGYITRPLLMVPAQWAADVPKNGEDYDVEIQAQILGKPQIVGDVIDFYERTFAGKPVIVPCSTYLHAEQMTEAFNERGWSFNHLHSALGKHDRKRILRRIAEGKDNGICTVGIGIEGMSIHGLYGVLWLRRTRSPIIWIQFNGRAERTVPGKRYYICADFVGNSVIHGMPDRDLFWKLEQENAELLEESAGSTDLIRMCPWCGVANSVLNTECHFCGGRLDASAAEVGDQTMIPAYVDGELVPVDSTAEARELLAQHVAEIKDAQADDRARAAAPREIGDNEKVNILRKNLFKGNRRKLFTDAVKEWL